MAECPSLENECMILQNFELVNFLLSFFFFFFLKKWWWWWFFFPGKMNVARLNALIWQSMWIFEKFLFTTAFIGVKTGPKWVKNVPKMPNKSKHLRRGLGANRHSWSANRHLGSVNQHSRSADWHFGVPISTPNLTPTFRIFRRAFFFFSFFFFEKIFNLFWIMKHFPSQLQTLWTYLSMVRD